MASRLTNMNDILEEIENIAPKGFISESLQKKRGYKKNCYYDICYFELCYFEKTPLFTVNKDF
jgi:hypothetical protein